MLWLQLNSAQYYPPHYPPITSNNPLLSHIISFFVSLGYWGWASYSTPAAGRQLCAFSRPVGYGMLHTDRGASHFQPPWGLLTLVMIASSERQIFHIVFQQLLAAPAALVTLFVTLSLVKPGDRCESRSRNLKSSRNVLGRSWGPAAVAAVTRDGMRMPRLAGM